MLQVQQFEESLPKILEFPEWPQLELFNYSCTQQGEQTFQIPQLSLSTINFQGYYMDASWMQNWEMTQKNKEGLKQSQIIIQKCGTCPFPEIAEISVIPVGSGKCEKLRNDIRQAQDD